MRKHLPWLILPLLLLSFVLGALMAGAQTPFTPAQATTITDPSRAWLKADHPVVTMRVRVNNQGRVDKVMENSVTSALKSIYEYVAKKEWLFIPATVDDRPVASEVTVELRYVVQSTQTIMSCIPAK